MSSEKEENIEDVKKHFLNNNLIYLRIMTLQSLGRDINAVLLAIKPPN